MLRLWSKGPILPLLSLVLIVDFVLVYNNECLFSFVDLTTVSYVGLLVLLSRIESLMMRSRQRESDARKSVSSDRFPWCVYPSVALLSLRDRASSERHSPFISFSFFRLRGATARAVPLARLAAAALAVALGASGAFEALWCRVLGQQRFGFARKMEPVDNGLDTARASAHTHAEEHEGGAPHDHPGLHMHGLPHGTGFIAAASLAAALLSAAAALDAALGSSSSKVRSFYTNPFSLY